MALILTAALGLVLTVAGLALSPWPWTALVVAGIELVAAAYLIADNR